MDNNRQYLKKLNDRIETIGFWQRLFSWKQAKELLIEAATADLQKMDTLIIEKSDCINKIEKLEKENTEKNQKIIDLNGKLGEKLSKEEVSMKYIDREAYNALHKQLSDTQEKLEKQQDQLNKLNTDFATSTESNKILQERVANSKQEMEELYRKFKEELTILQEQSQQTFKNMATDILEEKKKNFVGENKKELGTLLEPLKEHLKEFQSKVEATRKEDIASQTSLKKEIESLHQLNTQLSKDANNLANALKGDFKKQGNWGEDRLKAILDMEGFQENESYFLQKTYLNNEGNNQRPDVTILLPDNKSIIIDSKVSLNAYTDYFNAPTEEKEPILDRHLQNIKKHINDLSSKEYQSSRNVNTLDYVLMFVPTEVALTVALEKDPTIFEYAANRKIVLVSPTTVIATLKVVKMIWQKEKQAKNGEELYKQCEELHKKFVSFAESMDKIKKGLDVATESYREVMNHLKDGDRKGWTIIGRLEYIEKLGVKTSKKIPEHWQTQLAVNDDENIPLLQSVTKDMEEQE